MPMYSDQINQEGGKTAREMWGRGEERGRERELIVNCKRCAATGTDYVCGNKDCRIPPIPHTHHTGTDTQTHTHTHYSSFVLGWSPHCNR